MKFSYALVLIVVACGSLVFANHHKEAEGTSLEKLWETEAILKVPESVRFDKERKVLYVSNIDGQPWGKDGAGSIGKVNLDGRVIEVDWVKGLDAPKGMALFGSLLFVADLQDLVVIDVAEGEIATRIEFPEAEGLNDVSVNDEGVVFVTDSKKGDIYRVEANGESKRIFEGLMKVNGVLADGDELFIASNGGLHRASQEGGGELQLIADGLEGNADGIERVNARTWLISCWAGVVYEVKEGKASKLLDTREGKVNTADLGYDPVKRIAYLPTFWNNSVVAYRLK